ncbi:flagellar assembly protein FliH, partial [Halobellus sp. Atlit-31R]
MMIPKEQQSAYQRWELTSFGDERPSTQARRAAMAPPPVASEPEPIETVPNVVLPTAQELEAIREQARAEGYAEGLIEGRAAGHAEGYADGAKAGQAEAEGELEHLRAI